MANLPIFAIGKYEKIQPAIDAGTLTYPSYVFVDDLTRLAFIDKELNIRLIEGGDSETGGVTGSGGVERVDNLPDVKDASEDVLYIYNNIVYVFTGDYYKPMYEDYTSQITELQSDVSILNNREIETQSQINELWDTVNSISEGSSGLIFSTYQDFPSTGNSKNLYIDWTASSTRGIYAWYEEEGYIKLTGSSDLVFIDLDNDDNDDDDN